MPQIYHRTLRPYGICIPCANGYFKQLPGPQSCTACPFNMDTTLEHGSLKGSWTTHSGQVLPGYLGNYARSACHCISLHKEFFGNDVISMYRVNPEDAFTCETCPRGGKCNGLSKQQIIVKYGHWRTGVNITVIYQCPNLHACLGGVNSECSVGHEGNLCAVCSNGYAGSTFHSVQKQICIKCGPDVIGSLVLIVSYVAQGIVMMGVFRMATRKHNSAVGFCRIILSHFQVMVGHLHNHYPFQTLFCASSIPLAKASIFNIFKCVPPV